MPHLGKLYFAGGCFWGVQRYFERMPWVKSTRAGYANGDDDSATPTYESIGALGFAETVEVVYDVRALAASTLVKRFFEIIDPLSVNRQGGDVGRQYRTGVYYDNDEQLPELESAFAKVAQRLQRASGAPQSVRLATELEPLRSFYPAEDYHQDYLENNPSGYCHVPLQKLNQHWALIDSALYPRPSEEEIAQRLSTLEYAVTQNAATEKPFTGKYLDNYSRAEEGARHTPGIYVDIVTGEPLFTAADQFDAGCGWPSFAKPIDEAVLTEHSDTSIPGRPRVEIRSSAGDSHLGHVFDDGPAELGGSRYCINAASLRFVPQEQMEAAGYGYLLGAIEL